MLSHDHGDIDAIWQPAHGCLGKPLKAFLQGAIQQRVDPCGGRMVRVQARSKVGGMARQRLHLLGYAHSRCGQTEARQDAIPRSLRCARLPVWAPDLRGLGQRDQQRCLRRAQPHGGFSKPCPCARADALDRATIGRVLKIQTQNFLFAQPCLQRPGHTHLAQFSAPRSGARVLEQTRRLHGQGRASRDNFTGPQGLPSRPEKGVAIHA